MDVQNEDHRFADVGDEVAGHLVSAVSGAAEILWKESGTGVKWAVVRLGPHAGALLWAKAQGNSHDYGSDPHVSCKAVGGVSLAHGPPSSIARKHLPQQLSPSRQ
jgi:hypothetical protein